MAKSCTCFVAVFHTVKRMADSMASHPPLHHFVDIIHVICRRSTPHERGQYTTGSHGCFGLYCRHQGYTVHLRKSNLEPDIPHVQGPLSTRDENSPRRLRDQACTVERKAPEVHDEDYEVNHRAEMRHSSPVSLITSRSYRRLGGAQHEAHHERTQG